MRVTKSIVLKSVSKFKKQLLIWAQQYEHIVFLDSNSNQSSITTFESVLAVQANTQLKTSYHQAFDKLKAYKNETNDWIFGYLTYDLKNDIETLSSDNFDGLQFPDLCFFQPKKLFFIKGNKLKISYLEEYENEMNIDLQEIKNVVEEDFENEHEKVKIKLRIHKEEYAQKVTDLLNHIHRGDVYEVNFCQEFYAQETTINPLNTFFKLNNISKAPFTSFLRVEDMYLLSASPERYLKRKGTTVISQPIKGTAKRSKKPQEDNELKTQLSQNKKEQSENIMIVDLVRNDLSRVSKKGTVKVQELCKVYTFEQVHQLISTISCQVEENVDSVDIIKATFPMGSMTGAPKISAMKLIEELEETKRGLYSGTVGYFSPEDNFDFNVVIRSILYNQSLQYVSYSVGGAITAKSDVMMEYEECLVKAKAMREVLEG